MSVDGILEPKQTMTGTLASDPSMAGALASDRSMAGTLASAPYVPKRMAHKLTFTGAVEGEYDGSRALSIEIPEKMEESDPTVPAWAKEATKPAYTAEEVGAMPANATVVKTVNGVTPDKNGNVNVEGGTGGIAAETDPTVPAWAKAASKPKYTAEEVGALPSNTVIPTVPAKVSAFENDAGYLTEHQDLSGYAKKEDVHNIELDTTLTQLGKAADAKAVGDALAELEAQISESGGSADLTGYATEAWVEQGYQPKGNYATKAELPVVPTKVSAFENDKGYLTQHQDLSSYAKRADIPTSPEDIGAAPSSHVTNKSNPHGVTAAQIGLGNVNNTSDTNKPVSTAQAAAIADAKAAGTTAQNNLNSHTGNKSNPHGVTAAQVGAEPATADGTYPQCYYRMVGGEQEWLNPPMNPGTKYRTTERFRNKVVYTMIIDCGNWSDGKVVTANAGSTPYPIAFRGYAGPYAIPFINAKSLTDGSTTYVKVDRTGTNLRVTLQAGTGHTQYTYVQVWFVH